LPLDDPPIDVSIATVNEADVSRRGPANPPGVTRKAVAERLARGDSIATIDTNRSPRLAAASRAHAHGLVVERVAYEPLVLPSTSRYSHGYSAGPPREFRELAES
jgi:hypothetical protein